MAKIDNATEFYIEHEVALRVHDERFKALENSIKHIDNKINWIIGLVLTSVLIPVVLHLLELI